MKSSRRPTTAENPSSGFIGSRDYESASIDVSSFPVAWVPNACYLCSDDFKLSRGTGLDPRDVNYPCSACGTPGVRRPGTGYGPQYDALLRYETEILFGGSKGGGKSSCSIIWLTLGNPYELRGDPSDLNLSYTTHPEYRALILRKNEEDLHDYILECRKHFEPMGAVWKGGNISRFDWPSGAVMWTGHLKDRDSYQKYMGRSKLIRVIIEELTLIPEELTYQQILASMRSDVPGMRAQIFNTTNPEGPGLGWVKNRFIRLHNLDGSLVQPKATIWIERPHPYKPKKKVHSTRVFIPALLRDNPYLVHSEVYLALLADMPDKQRRAYLYGDWDVLEGTFFGLFRNPLEQTLPFTGEPDNACHVVTTSKRLEKGNMHRLAHYPTPEGWWRREAGGDWGYIHNSSILWAYENPETLQINIHRELVVNNTDPEALGVSIAESSIDDLNASSSHSLTLWFSPDAFKRSGMDKGITSHIQLIERGIAMILGPSAVRVPEFGVDTSDEDWRHRMGIGLDATMTEVQQKYTQWLSDILRQAHTGITIRRANSNRVLGWSYMTQLMRWEPPVEVPNDKYDPQVERELGRKLGAAAAMRYRQRFLHHQGLYPRLQIWDTCPHLMAAIPAAMHNPGTEDIIKTHWDGADSVDSARYLLLGFQSAPQQEPFEAMQARAAREARKHDPNANIFLMQQHFENQKRQGFFSNAKLEPRLARIAESRAKRRDWVQGRLVQ